MSPRPRRAWLIDVYVTTISIDFGAIWERLGAVAEVDPSALRSATDPQTSDVMTGRSTFREALGRGLVACGVPAAEGLLDELMAIDAAMLRELAHVHEDTLDLLGRIRAAGEPVAFVSNCDDNTRALLVDLGLATRADHLVLSHELRVAKPSPEIYRTALDLLAVSPADATLVDDDPAYCEGARAVGVTTIQIDRRGSVAGGAGPGGHRIVGSLTEVDVG